MTEEELFVREQITKIYDQLLINCKKTCGAGYNTWGHDLLALTIEMYLEKPLEYQLKVISDNKLENFLTFVMGLQLKSSSSRFYHHYRKPFEKSRELFDNYNYKKYLVQEKTFKAPDIIEGEPDELMECLKLHREKLNPFEKMVLDRVMVNGEQVVDVSRDLDIPYHHFAVTRTKIIKKVKSACQHLLS